MADLMIRSLMRLKIDTLLILLFTTFKFFMKNYIFPFSYLHKSHLRKNFNTAKGIKRRKEVNTGR